MAGESSLSLKVSDIQARLGRFAGWGSTPSGWTTEQLNIIKDATDSGLRRFYFPAPADQVGAGYEWSFLKPIAQGFLDQGESTMQLPDDYNTIYGPITLAAVGTATQPYKIEWSNEGKLREMYSVFPSLTGPPMYVSIRSIPGTSATAGQRFQLFFFPSADQDYTVQFQYGISPNVLDGSAPYAYGGSHHTETILESCLAVMEERLDDMPAGTGPHSIAFQQRLLASIAMDRRNKPPKLGRNLDRSDDVYYGYPSPWWHGAAPPATYNGGSLG